MESIEHISVSSKRPTRILFLMVGLGLGGAERVVAEIAKALDPRRFSVEVYSLKGPGPVGEAMTRAGIRVTAPRGWRRMGSLCSLWRRIVRGDFDVVHSHLIWANIAAVLMAKRVPVIWHEHDTQEWMRWGHRFLYRLFIGRSDHVVTVSCAVGDWIRAAYPGLGRRVSVIPNLLPADCRVPKAPEPFGETEKRGLKIGFVGRLEEPKKGLAVLLEAMTRVIRIHPNAICQIIGDGPARNWLLDRRKLLGLERAVEFLGAKTEMAAFYQTWDIFVLPSLWEGFGLVLLEAMAAGLPIVASRVGGVPEIVRDGQTGILVPPGDPDRLAHELCRLVENPGERQAMGKVGRAAVERYRSGMVIPELERLYEKLSRNAFTQFGKRLRSPAVSDGKDT